jgi:VCBS repeat-containing protein
VRSGDFGLDNRIIVAGGGGGAGGAAGGGGSGGAGGGVTGVGGFPASFSGGGGTASKGGDAGGLGAVAGDFGTGGSGASSSDGGGGGGGGGYYGGGGGGIGGLRGGGGGGGSGFGPSGVVFQSGVRSGDGLVTITYTPPAVNDAPVNSVPGDQSTDEDTPLTFNSANTNPISISDVDAGTSPVKVTLAVSNGTLTLGDTSGLSFATGDGTDDASMAFTGTISTINTALSGLTFDPEANYNGAAELTITTDDQGNTGLGGAKSDTDTVNITVNSVNDVPVAANDSHSTEEDTLLSVTAANGVLANDSDVEGSSLSAVLVVGPAHAAATDGFSLNQDGSFSYTPEANYHGPDSFTYKANDGSALSNVVTVSLTVNALNDAPKAVNDTLRTDEETAGTANVLTNDTDVDNSNNTNDGLLVHDGDNDDANGISPVTAPSDGTLTLNANGTFTYTPNTNFSGTDSFTYKASDGTAESNTATVTITVTPVNDKPLANNDAASVVEGATVANNINVLTNDTDVDGDALEAVLVSGPAHASSFNLNADGSFSYTHDGSESTSDSFTYKASDGTADSEVATVNISVTPENDAPTVSVAAGGSCGTNDRSGTINLTVNDPDGQAGSLTLSATSSRAALVPASNVTFGGQGAARTLTASAVSGRTGAALITVTVSDGTDEGTVALRLQAGGNSNNTLTGTSATDILLGQNGDDTLSGLGGNDLLCGARGNDRLTGGTEADRFEGGSGNDRAADFTASEGDTKDNTVEAF